MRTLLAALLLLVAACGSPTAPAEPETDVDLWGKYVSVGEAPHHEWYFESLQSGETLVMGYYLHGDTLNIYVGYVTVRGRGVGWHDFVGVHHDEDTLIGVWRGYPLRLEREVWGTVVP